ncbi:MAG: HIT domain-containing protein [Rhodospirillales bacterium]|nr:HIT domain-containing protein [Rhodospirillales bacterium]
MINRKADPNCPFCTTPETDMIFARRLAYVIYDTTPVTPLHMLILTRRHAPSYFDLRTTERRAIEELLVRARAMILAQDETVLGFNIGINVGEVAGQTIISLPLPPHSAPAR